MNCKSKFQSNEHFRHVIDVDKGDSVYNILLVYIIQLLLLHQIGPDWQSKADSCKVSLLDWNSVAMNFRQ